MATRPQAQAEPEPEQQAEVSAHGTEAEWLEAERARLQAEAEVWADERIEFMQENSTVPEIEPEPPEPVPATGATAGTPGTFTPAGCDTPADISALSSVAASPVTAWVTGEHVVLADASHAHWDGATWAVGDAP